MSAPSSSAIDQAPSDAGYGRAGIGRAGRGGADTGRLEYLDGVRAVAVVAVLMLHWAGLNWSGLNWTGATVSLRGGAVGVDLFFILSGYVITRALLRHPIGYRDFMRRRFWRLYPALLVMVVLVTALRLLTELPALPLAEAGLALTQLMAPVRAQVIFASMVNHTWSLCLEWYFYAVWPLVLGPLRRLRRPDLACYATALALYLVSWPLPRDFFYYCGPERFGELLIGCGLALRLPAATRWWRLALAVTATAWVGFVLFADGLAFYPIRSTGIPITVGFGAAVIVAGGSGLAGQWLSRAAPLGRASYSLYLWHVPIWVLTPLDGLARWVVASALTALVTWLSYRYLERLRLRVV